MSGPGRRFLAMASKPSHMPVLARTAAPQLILPGAPPATWTVIIRAPPLMSTGRALPAAPARLAAEISGRTGMLTWAVPPILKEKFRIPPQLWQVLALEPAGSRLVREQRMEAPTP